MKALRIRRVVVTALLMPTLAVVPSCSIFQSANQQLTVVPSEEQAEIYINGKSVGTGTTTVKLKRGKDYSVMAKLGDRAATEKVGRKISGTGVADIVGGILFLFPFIGVFSPGFWDLNPQQLSIALPAGASYLGVSAAPRAMPPQPRPSTSTSPVRSTNTGDRLPARRSETR